jgi:hypothetical protein
MLRTRLLLILALLGGLTLFGAVTSSQGPDSGKILEDQKILAAEYDLARQAHSYFVLDIRQKKLDLKVKGMVLRTWLAQNIRFWGRPAFSKTIDLAKKTALKAPQRNVIKPGEVEKKPSEPGKFDIEALELKDMPESFSLYFDNGLHISIKTAARSIAGHGRTIHEALNWYVWLPVKNFLASRRGKPLAELEFTFKNGQDAQAVYWVFYEGIKGLIY